MNENKAVFGLVSMIGTVALLGIIAWNTEVFGVVFSELGLLLSGRVLEIASNQTTFLMMFPIIFAVAIMELPCAIGAGALQTKLLGASGKHAVSNTLKKMTEGNHFFSFFGLVLAEELFARWLFLGVLTQLPFLSGTFAFYLLFLLGNGMWALVHLRNFEEEKDKKILRVLPQFIAGIFYTYIFVKHGLLATVLTHFASNAILFATHKIQRIDSIDVLIVGYAALCAVTSYVLLEKPLAELLPWFIENPVFSLEGWNFWDYVKVSIFFSSSFVFIFGILLYDRGQVGKKKPDKNTTFINYVIGIPILIPIIIAVLYGIYALLGLFIEDVPYRILLLAIIFTFIQTGSSGSAVARTFWSSLPDMYITMCILQAIGFWPAILFVFAKTAIYAPFIVLHKFDD